MQILFSEYFVFLLFFTFFSDYLFTFSLSCDIIISTKRKGGRTTNQLNLYLKSKERGTVQCRGQSKLKRVNKEKRRTNHQERKFNIIKKMIKKQIEERKRYNPLDEIS